MGLNDDHLANLARVLRGSSLLGHLAVMHGWVTEAALRESLDEQRRTSRPLGAILVARGLLTADQLAEILRQQQAMEAPACPEGVTRMVGRYAITEQLGIGGAGVVWKAWDTKLLRWVAFKQPRLDHHVSRDRFLLEAQAAARLHHPSLIEVFEIGQADGLDYIVMDYVDGRPLNDVRMEPRAVAAAMADVGDGVHAMHGAGVLHRDIKPQNILIDAAGKAHLGDFGLAKIEGRQPLTVEGTFLGTPQYVAPEQAAGHAVDARTDVYGLGATMYHALTGREPYAGENSLTLLFEKLMKESLPSPATLNPAVPRELSAIVHKAMARLPEDRYASAAEMAADLRRFLAGEPVNARPISAATRATRWMTRNPLVTGALATLILGVAAVGIFLRHRGEREQSYETARSDGDELWRRAVECARAPGERDALRRHAEAALARFQSACETMPDRAYPWLMRGRCLRLLNRGGEAEAAWTRAISLQPDFGAALFERGKLALDVSLQMRTPPGVRVGDGGARVRYSDPEGDEERRWREKGRQDLQLARKAKGLDGSALKFLEGELLFGEHRYVEAAAALRPYASDNPWDASGLSLLAATEYYAGEFEAAEATWSRAIDLEPRPGRFKARGDVRYCLRRYEPALADYDQALAKDPDACGLLCNRGLAREKLGRRTEAIEDFTRAIALKPGFARAFNNRGTARAAILDLEQAEADLQEAVRLNPLYAEAYNNLGNVLVMRDRANEAVTEYDAALEIEPDYAEALGNRAIAQITLKQFDRAVSDLNRVLTLDPGSVEMLYQRARALKGKGESAAAAADLQQALRRAPADWPRRRQAEELLREWKP